MRFDWPFPCCRLRSLRSLGHSEPRSRVEARVAPLRSQSLRCRPQIFPVRGLSPLCPPCAGAFRRVLSKLSFRLGTGNSNVSYIHTQGKAQLLFLAKSCAKSTEGNAGYGIGRVTQSYRLANPWRSTTRPIILNRSRSSAGSSSSGKSGLSERRIRLPLSF